MDLQFLEGTDYILDVWSRRAAENPAAPAFADEFHPRGLNRQQADELSARVYGWLKAKGIGREDFVFLCLPRGAIALISMIGVWKAGAAFTMVEDQYPPERNGRNSGDENSNICKRSSTSFRQYDRIHCRERTNMTA